VIWIFALGIIGFCIVSRGFRKLVLYLLAFVACVTGAVVAYNLYQSHIQEQQAAQQRAQEQIDAAKYPLCVGKDQLQAFWTLAENGDNPLVTPTWMQYLSKIRSPKLKLLRLNNRRVGKVF
jgi:hypothetical protein